MKTSGLLVLRLLAIPLVLVLLILPIFALLASSSEGALAVPFNSFDVIVRTLLWSLSVAVVATAIGWLVGIRLATLRPQPYFVFNVMLLMSLAIPAYAVFYAWWQAWPAGSWLHNYIVEREALILVTKACAFAALVGWSWPIPALICAMTNKSNDGISLLHSIDGAGFMQRCWHRIQIDKRSIVLALLLVTSITASNTTCFDLAQISTIGNELRAVIASGGSILSAPWLSFTGVCFAFVAMFILLKKADIRPSSAVEKHRSILPLLCIWFLFTCLPLLVGAISSIRSDGFQLWSQYSGDVFVSSEIALCTAFLTCAIAFVSTSLRMSQSAKTTFSATMFDVVWLIAAFVPASLMAFAVGSVWNTLDVDAVQRTPVILIFAQAARFGFVGVLAGRWISSCSDAITLQRLDSPCTLQMFVRALRPRIMQAMCAVFAITIAMSFAEISLTSQLAPPATNQPIAVALLNAMHYQRPQIVTSALSVMLLIAVLGGLCIVLLHRKYLYIVVVCCCALSCKQAVHNEPAQNTQIIGGVGYQDGQFITPRAIASNEEVIVVIDKSGRLQRFSHDGDWLSSWELELSSTGFPTGVSIDEHGNIWIADTHKNRVLVINKDGEVILTFGEYGVGDGQFLYPTDIAFGTDGEVYVSEYGGNDRISVFDTKGNFIRTIGSHGTGIKEFRRPQSIEVDEKGDLYVVDSGNHRVVVMHTNGEVLNIISSVGREESQLLYPYGIMFDTPDSILVCEFGNNRLHRFSRDGVTLGLWGGAGDRVGYLQTPWGIAKSRDGIVVADTGNNRLQLMPYMMIK